VLKKKSQFNCSTFLSVVTQEIDCPSVYLKLTPYNYKLTDQLIKCRFCLFRFFESQNPLFKTAHRFIISAYNVWVYCFNGIRSHRKNFLVLQKAKSDDSLILWVNLFWQIWHLISQSDISHKTQLFSIYRQTKLQHDVLCFSSFVPCASSLWARPQPQWSHWWTVLHRPLCHNHWQQEVHPVGLRLSQVCPLVYGQLPDLYEKAMHRVWLPGTFIFFSNTFINRAR
jgi:hypothetical protein